MSREQSTIGASTNYGERVTNEGLDSSVASQVGLVYQRELKFNFTQANAGLPTVNADVDAAVLVVPANSLLVRAYLQVTTAFTSGGAATLELGLQDTAGVAIDADGIDTIAVATLTANSWTTCDGALVGATTGTADAQISIDDATAAFTAGEGRLIVEYIPQR